MEGLVLTGGFNSKTRIFQLSKESGMHLVDTELGLPVPRVQVAPSSTIYNSKAARTQETVRHSLGSGV